MTIFCSHCHRPLQAEMSCLPRRAKQAPSASRPFSDRQGMQSLSLPGHVSQMAGWLCRSTKSASKARRDQINAELQALRSLLPISAEEKERLSYLHTMALVCLRLRGAQLFPPGTLSTAVLHAGLALCGALLLPHPRQHFTLLPTQAWLLLRVRPSAQNYSPCSRDFCLCSQPTTSWSTSQRTWLRCWASPCVTYHLGYHREELVGQSWYSLLHPEDADLAAAQHRAVALGSGAGPAAGTAVLRVLRKDRAWTWLRVWARRDGGCITCTCRCLREEEAAHLRTRQPRAAAPPAGRDLGRLAEQLRALADSLSPPAPRRWPRPEEAEDDASVCLGNSLLDPPQFLRFPFEQKIGCNIPSVLSQVSSLQRC
ncbi:neuronal PAS domain-containing protein 4 isoform X3 [Corvus kubaryi]|uniref:neuronal PAS domain-containing protein 4 isoform X3 n=1 Tax=Corvus kubaryi TaxID=68294 RepID=UPI001C05DC35|nr:neuronal PAS domain-containing protein 4 isoform X3 [Corvus kubaryi]